MEMKVVSRIVMVLLASAAPAWAQGPAQAARSAERTELRHQIFVMEGALARAVEFGAQQLNREVRSVAPEMFLLAGDAQARGVYLDGYGVFFDVAVPMLRQSLVWSLRTMLQQNDTTTRSAVAEIRRHIQRETNPAARQSLEAAIARLEAQATPLAQIGRPWPPSPMAPSPGLAAAVSATDAPAPAPSQPPATADSAPWLADPNRAYTESVQRALIDAMLDFSAPMAIANDEWLTVAARDNERRDALAPQDPYEQVVTVLMRIKGSDLREYRAGRIDKVEARKRFRIGEF